MSFILVAYFTVPAQSKEWVSINGSAENQSSIKLISSSESHTTLELSLNGYYRSSVHTGVEQAYIISLDDASPIIKKGTPNICKVSQSIIIPDEFGTEIEIVDSEYYDVKDIKIAPSKGIITRDEDPAMKAYTYSSVYQSNNYYPGLLADLNEPYILRDFRGQTINFYPFQYNAVKQTLRVYTKLIVKVSSINNQRSTNEFNRTKSLTSIQEEFKSIYSNHFINSNRFQYIPANEDGKMLVISHGPFVNAMMPFVKWKNERGQETEIIDVATIGNTSTAIKSYISNYYSNNNLSFVLLVGDNIEVATPMHGGSAADPTYGHILGSDSYPEVFIGRFSAQSVSHVQTQVQRVLDHERDAGTADTWYGKGVVVASDQGPGDDGEMDWQHARNMRADLQNYNFSTVDELYDGSQGGADAPGNPSPSMLLNSLLDGRSIFTYTGHGTSVNCATTGLSVSHVNSMANVGKLPIVLSVACVNGNFVNTTCFAETFLRAEHNGAPTGAVATIMSSINQSWAPPMDAQDEMIDIITESYQNNIKRTFGGVTANGCMHMNDEYGASGYPMTDTWHIFGDPSLQIRTATPTLITASYPQTMLIGTNQLSVPCGTENAMVSLTINSEIISKAPVTGGFANLSFSSLQSLDTIKITITGYNKVALQDEIAIIPAAGPYVIHAGNTATEIIGNNDGEFDFDEELDLNVVIQNMGVADAMQVSVSLASSDPYVTILNSNANYGNINSGATAVLNAAYKVKIADDVPNHHVISFDVTATDSNGNSWLSNFSRVVKAPEIKYNIISINDNSGGNGNGIAEPGETVVLLMEINNIGQSISPFATASLSSTNMDITINNSNSLLGNIVNGNKAIAAFNITYSANMAFGTPVEYVADVNAGKYSDHLTFYRSAGIPLEDFETGSFNSFGWNTGGHSPWFASNNSPYEGDFCSESGDIHDNQKSEFSITVNVLGNDSISFARKTSSELHWDYLRFYIDGVKKAEWSGQMGWGIETFHVGPGVHTFKWAYEKDAVVSAYSDRAWIDNIYLPAFLSTTTSVDEDVFLHSMNVFPNPTTDYLNLNFQLKKKENFTLKLIDVQGKVLDVPIETETRMAGPYSERLDVRQLSNGLYFVLFELSNQTIIHKVLISR